MVIVGFKLLGGAEHQDQPGLLPEAVLVKFHDPHVSCIYSYLGMVMKLSKFDRYQPNSLPNKV